MLKSQPIPKQKGFLMQSEETGSTKDVPPLSPRGIVKLSTFVEKNNVPARMQLRGRQEEVPA